MAMSLKALPGMCELENLCLQLKKSPAEKHIGIIRITHF